MDTPVTEDEYVPTAEDLRYWAEATADEPAVNGTTWKWTDLANPDLDIPPQPPEIHGLLYAGKRHVISGAPESAKTLIAYTLILEAQAEGRICAIIDFEMGAYAARRLLLDLGANTTQLHELIYIEPEGPPTPNDIKRIEAQGTEYVLIDAAAGAYDTQGLDDNSRKDVEKFATRWTRPLWKAGIATIMVDHVTKNTETRGRFAIGSERKLGGADIHLGLEAIKTISRGTTGLVKINVHKDRPGYLERPTAFYLHLESDPETHQIAWELKAAETHAPDEDGFRPTHLMEKVSRWLEEQGGRHSGNQIEKAKLGKNDYVRKALKCLAQEGYIGKNDAGRGYEYVHISTYRESDDLAPEEPSNHAGLNLAPTSPHLAPGEVSATSPLAPPLTERGEVRGEGELDVHDPAVQALLDDDGIPF